MTFTRCFLGVTATYVIYQTYSVENASLIFGLDDSNDLKNDESYMKLYDEYLSTLETPTVEIQR